MGIRKRRLIQNRLRVLRAERRLTQAALARRARLTQSRVSFIENGYIEASTKERDRLARAFKVTVADVFPAVEDVPEAMAS